MVSGVESRPSMAVIILTRLHNRYLWEAARRYGAQIVLYKPMTSGDELNKAVVKTISKVAHDHKRPYGKASEIRMGTVDLMNLLLGCSNAIVRLDGQGKYITGHHRTNGGVSSKESAFVHKLYYPADQRWYEAQHCRSSPGALLCNRST